MIINVLLFEEAIYGIRPKRFIIIDFYQKNRCDVTVYFYLSIGIYGGFIMDLEVKNLTLIHAVHLRSKETAFISLADKVRSSA